MRIGGMGGNVLPSSAWCRSRSAAATSIRRWKRGVLDGVEFVGPYDDEKLGFAKRRAVLLLSRLLGGWPDRPRLRQPRLAQGSGLP